MILKVVIGIVVVLILGAGLAVFLIVNGAQRDDDLGDHEDYKE